MEEGQFPQSYFVRMAMISEALNESRSGQVGQALLRFLPLKTHTCFGSRILFWKDTLLVFQNMQHVICVEKTFILYKIKVGKYDIKCAKDAPPLFVTQPKPAGQFVLTAGT